jgi:glycerol-3-phosphate dehydrogenase
MRCDVAIIGGGVLGTAIAARLSRTRARVVLLERSDDLAEGASKGNAGIATSFYGAPGTLEAELVNASNPRWESLCASLDVPYRRIGAVLVATDDEQEAALADVASGIAASGARVELLDADDVRALEPLVTPSCRGGILLPDEGIIDPMRLTCAYGELAARNGVDVWLDASVVGLAEGVVRTTRGEVSARVVVNASGVEAGRVAALAGGEEIRMWPRKGQYWVLDREFGARMSRLVYPVPGSHTRGVQVVPTTNGSVLLGPSAHDISDPLDKATDLETLDDLFAQARALVPAIAGAAAIKSFAANRPASEETVRIRADAHAPWLIHVWNRSSGVSSSPATADHVARLIGDLGVDVSERGGALSRLPVAEPAGMTATQVVCVCEQVSAAKITAALERQVPARSIDGVRKRTQATGGRCQGAYCMAGVAFLCSLHTGDAPHAVRASGGTLGVASA